MPEASLSDKQFQRLSAFIEGEVGIKMPPVKRVMLEGRLRKRLRALSMASFDEYVEHVFSCDDGEIVHMIDVVTTNKTDFFREPEHFDYLRDSLLPRQASQGWGMEKPFLAWSAASSTGEEAYSLAVTFEEFRRVNPAFSYRILGTDISTAVLHVAEKAVYPAGRIQPVSQVLRKRYFLRSRDRAADLVRLRPEVRQNVLFKRLNLMQEKYPMRDLFHVIFCRNVIIYFDRHRQEALLRRLCDYLVPGGYLFLGHSESMASSNLPFESVAPTVYRRLEGSTE
ncbi:MCP methyltransferase, CheR-type [Alkalispirochaeta americana]|uniref:protein-glutamate O-methyltransferase n=1 Tax=Alkalispirochaeta americana TaxID=159291 RepID=A0A1N6QZE7_9SPIO|nr:CheR family methyltransferase [Alkalispirochaeta americana]SIQ21882.1 MCP methyltransferase, CheR-type [Alkalispirochaeta americana]